LEEIITGENSVFNHILSSIDKINREKRRPAVIAFDGFLGVDFDYLTEKLKATAATLGRIELQNVISCYKPQSWIEEKAALYLTDDPSFGKVNNDTVLGHIFDPQKLETLRTTLKEYKKKRPEPMQGAAKKETSAIVVFGIGAAYQRISPLCDLVFYFDLTREHLLKAMWHDQVAPLGAKNPAPIWWKTLYYFYYPMLIKQKKSVLEKMDYYIDANMPPEIKLIPRKQYRWVLDAVTRYPVKCKRIFMPGTWGGYFFKEYMNMPELPVACWNVDFSGMDSNILIDIGNDKYIEMQLWNLYSAFPVEIVGEYCHKKYPGNFPIQVGIDDGYFPEPVSHERRAMPVHLHPDTKYVKENFNESLGRYEVYYIARAYEGANTMLGLKEGVDEEEFKKKIIESEKSGKPFDWSSYVKQWNSREGDLQLIPAGTIHGTGGNQMILEMDTCPSICGTEYSFFVYDFCRNTWNYDKNDFSGSPVKLQVHHGLNQARWYRKGKWVENKLLATPRTIREGDRWKEERFDTHAHMPYLIERLTYETAADADTENRFFHCIYLTRGERTKIVSADNPNRSVELECFQGVLVPASFGKYHCINLGDGPCTVVRMRWKRG